MQPWQQEKDPRQQEKGPQPAVQAIVLDCCLWHASAEVVLPVAASVLLYHS